MENPPDQTGWTPLEDNETIWHRWRRPVLAVVLAAGVVLGLASLGRPSPSSQTPATTTTDQRVENERAYCTIYATEHLDTELYKVGGAHWVDAVNDCVRKRLGD